MSFDLVKSEQLPLIPEDWDYYASVEKVRPLVFQWKRITEEIATELYIAKNKTSQWGGDRKSEGYKNQVVSCPLDLSWKSYCEEIGLNRRTADRWINAVFPHALLIPPPLPKQESQVLYADPPWAFDNSGFDQSANQQYETLKPEIIEDYTDEDGRKIRDLAKQKESVLFLWVPSAIVPEGLQILKGWGFAYKSQIVWKKDKAPGIGWWVNSKHELLFIGAKGTELHPAQKYDSVFEAPVTQHSKKPELVYEMIEKMYTGPYIELFARNTRPGWVSWGNEV